MDFTPGWAGYTMRGDQCWCHGILLCKIFSLIFDTIFSICLRRFPNPVKLWPMRTAPLVAWASKTYQVFFFLLHSVIQHTHPQP